MDDHLTPRPPADAGAVPSIGALLDQVAEKAEAITTFAGTADLCGHPERTGNAMGYCAECWAVFKEEQGIDQHDHEMAVWDKVQDALAQVIEHPEKRKRILTRRLKAVRAKMIMNLPLYASIHLKAARIAADEGDARPAEWALANLTTDSERAVEVAKAGGTGVNGGVKVFIGVKVGDMPPSTTAIDISGDVE